MPVFPVSLFCQFLLLQPAYEGSHVSLGSGFTYFIFGQQGGSEALHAKLTLLSLAPQESSCLIEMDDAVEVDIFYAAGYYHVLTAYLS